MMERKGRIITLTTLAVLFLISLGLGIYFLLNKRNGNITLDKYMEVLSLCNSQTEEKKLSVDCDALMTNLFQNENAETCVELQIIGKNLEIKSMTICEPYEKLTYTNEILMYKTLMPVKVKISYNRKDLLGNYSFATISLERLSEGDVQKIVNRDITNLVKLESDSTTILNSADFCPRSESLPEYISEENKQKYTEFVTQNLGTEDTYKNVLSSVSAEESTFNRLFICDSSEITGMTEVCDKTNIKNISVFPTKIRTLNFNFSNLDYQSELDEKNLIMLNQISTLYDGMYHTNSTLMELMSNFNTFVTNLSQLNPPNERILCALAKLYEPLSEVNTVIAQDFNRIAEELQLNTSQINSSLCIPFSNENNIDKQGAYIKILLENTKINEFTIFERCNNLNMYLQ